MKITIKVSPETLFACHKLVMDRAQDTTWNICRRVAKSMQVELFEILSRSCLSYGTNPNGKPRRLTLRFHLAYELYKTITEHADNPNFGIYERNKLDQLKNTLHQALL